MKLSKKVLTAGIAAALTLSLAVTAFAANEINVKEKKIKHGNVVVRTPVVTGSKSGPKMDTLLTQMTTKNVVDELYKYLPTDGKTVTLEGFIEFTNYDSLDPIKSGFDLVDSSSLLINAGFDKEQKKLGKTKAEEKYKLDIDYTLYAVADNILSLEQHAAAYTGGAHGNESVTTLTVSPETGKVYSLSDMFLAGSDYKGRLEMLMTIQQKGDNRLREMIGQPAVEYQKIAITGNEKFYFNADINNAGLCVIYNPGEVAPMAAGIQNFYIPIDTISDILEYNPK